jgi:dihydroorotase
MLELLAHVPHNVETGEIVHGERTHRHAEILERLVDLLHRRAFLDEELGLAKIRLDHAIADEAARVAREHGNLLQSLAERHRGGDYFVAARLAAYHFEQLHDIRRAEEMRPDDHFRAAGARSDLVYIER